MNRLVFLFAIVVGFTYFGGSSVPKILVDNKKVLLGITLGLLIGSFNLGNFNRVGGLFGGLVEGVYTECNNPNCCGEGRIWNGDADGGAGACTWSA